MLQSIEEFIAEVAAIAAAEEVYVNPSDAISQSDLQRIVARVALRSHEPRLFVVHPDGSGFEWSVPQRMERQLAAMCGDQPLGDENVDISLLTLPSGKTVSVHKSLDEQEKAELLQGMQEFAAWKRGDANTLGELSVRDAEAASAPSLTAEEQQEPKVCVRAPWPDACVQRQPHGDNISLTRSRS